MRIAFCGPMRVGKDTAAEYLKSKVGGRILKFADPLYEMQDAIYRIAGLELLKNGEKHRGLLQYLGTQWGRMTISDSLWLDIFNDRVHNIHNETPNENLFCTDSRFANEVVLLKQLGFTIIYLQAEESILIERGATFTNHESEQYMKNFTEYDLRIQNNGTLDEYFASLEPLQFNPTFAQGAN